jgi:hypothetical protein
VGGGGGSTDGNGGSGSTGSGGGGTSEGDGAVLSSSDGGVTPSPTTGKRGVAFGFKSDVDLAAFGKSVSWV